MHLCLTSVQIKPKSPTHRAWQIQQLNCSKNILQCDELIACGWARSLLCILDCSICSKCWAANARSCGWTNCKTLKYQKEFSAESAERKELCRSGRFSKVFGLAWPAQPAASHSSFCKEAVVSRKTSRIIRINLRLNRKRGRSSLQGWGQRN